MTKARHAAVVTAIYNRAKRITGAKGLDKTQEKYGDATLCEDIELPGAWRTATTTFSPLELQRASIQERLQGDNMVKDLLKIHGTAPGKKREGICRILYENANGLDCRNLEHPKVVKA